MNQASSKKDFQPLDIDQKAWRYMRDSASQFPNWQSRIALSDGSKVYTYSQFFQLVKKYAAVFSALSMTQKGRARVGLIGTGAVETIAAMYALNMTGAEVSIISSLSVLKAERLLQVVTEEHLTDLIITDELIQDNTLQEVIQKKDIVGLRFILLLHLPICGCTVPLPFIAAFEQKAFYTRCCWGMLYMDYLVNVYGNTPISYADKQSNDNAFILHTSGTTGGSGTPIVMSDRAFNAMSRCIIQTEGYDELRKDPSVALLVDLSNVYGSIIQVHMPLCLGGKISTVPLNALNPFFPRIIPAEKVSVLFCNGAIIDLWIKMAAAMQFDFSSVECVMIGGTSMSADDKKRYKDFLTKYGMKDDVPILNGYGISELGGVCTLSSPDLDDETIGWLLDGFEARFFDEETEVFKSMSDAPCEGVLYLCAETMCSGTLDGKQCIETETIDGKQFVCTNDLVGVDETGRLTYLGRSNRYFLHADGRKYQSGRVEIEIAKQHGVKSCGIVPVFDKPIHDNIPMLCVSTVQEADDPESIVKQALLSVFGIEGTLAPDDLPLLVLIADELPRNANGKIDLYRLNRNEVDGIKYEVKPRKVGEQIADIELEILKEDPNDIVTKMYKGIAKDIVGESIPGQVAGGIKQIGNSIKPAFHLNNMQYTQMMAWIFQAWQQYNQSNGNKKN